MSDAERKIKRAHIYTYRRDDSESWTLEELPDRLDQVRALCRGHDDCTVTIRPVGDGEWELGVYGMRLETQEEANWRAGRDARIEADKEKRQAREVRRKQQNIQTAILMLGKAGYTVTPKEEEGARTHDG